EPTKRYADIIVPEGGENHVAIDLITTKVASFLNHK
ncbi:TPA: uridine kinase, partial [Escherichia coli]|nr:uridine kinase [Escherichia coli]